MVDHFANPGNQRGLSPLPLRSAVEGVAWPALHGVHAAQLLAHLYQLELTQWWSADQLASHQLDQFAALAGYAAEQSEHFRKRFADAGLPPEGPWTWEKLSRLPLLTRRQLITEGAAIHCREVPAAHGAVGEVETSGSTGEKVQVRCTGVIQLKTTAFTLREHVWHQRDFSQSLAAIRANTETTDDDERAHALGWGTSVRSLFHTGPGYTQPLKLDVKEQAKWLLRRNPGYLLTYPTNLAGLMDEFERLGQVPTGLLQVRTVGETVNPGLPARCQAVLGVPLIDVYSSQEVGLIAAMCPTSGLYHIQSESLIVEILDEKGQPCAPGQTGRVVVTDLHNFATPIIRYELRDYAEVGPVCPCGRGLPTLKRIVGRERNMMRLPTGERFWAFVGFYRFGEVAKILQAQVVQHTLTELEVRLVVEGGLDATQQGRMTEIIREASGYPFSVRFSFYPDQLPRGAGEKFEEFMCLVE